MIPAAEKLCQIILFAKLSILKALIPLISSINIIKDLLRLIVSKDRFSTLPFKNKSELLMMTRKMIKSYSNSH